MFKVRRIRSGVRPNKPNQDAFSIQRVLGVELVAVEAQVLGDVGLRLAVGAGVAARAVDVVGYDPHLRRPDPLPCPA